MEKWKCTTMDTRRIGAGALDAADHAAVLFWWLAGVRFLMANDATIDAKPRWRDWLRAARQYRVPGPWKLIVTVTARYLRPSHHPSTEASTQMAMDYLEQSPAARAARQAAAGQQQSDGAEKADG
jgi:hypothetical protein